MDMNDYETIGSDAKLVVVEELDRIQRVCKDEPFIIEDGLGGTSAEWHPDSGLMVKIVVGSDGHATYYISEGTDDSEPTPVSKNLFTSILRVYGESIRSRRLY